MYRLRPDAELLSDIAARSQDAHAWVMLSRGHIVAALIRRILIAHDLKHVVQRQLALLGCGIKRNGAPILTALLAPRLFLLP
jgi:hypothetical protein